jgi:succinate dehydrogenase / fumarate reductase cytochrome b subunit
MSLMSALRSTMGRKALMAVSGVMLIGFVVSHMLGNLKLYQGAAKIDGYASWLRQVGTPAIPESGVLWIMRLALLGAVVVHIVAAWQVTLVNRRARPVGYTRRRNVSSDYAARTMRWGGVIILLFIVYHLLHLTWGTVHPDFQEHQVTADGDVYFVYHNVVAGFKIWWVSAFYALAQICLGLHLYHGVWSMLQTLGLSSKRSARLQRRVALGLALAVTLVNLSFPISVLAGRIR